ncbi:histone deacetylase [Chloroflexota bacterium]
MKTGLVYSPVYLKHDTGSHPETSARLEVTVALLEKSGLISQLVPVPPYKATISELALVHSKRYIMQIRKMAEDGGGWLDADTVMSSHSYDAALYASGGVIEATRAVLEGVVESVFALIRPPGHHARRNRAQGFCLFNNLAIAAEYALVNYDLERILIVDFDVHHGNGTQDAFYDNPAVLYISVHEGSFYPGTGGVDETGDGVGVGANINIPLPANCGDSEYLKAFEEIIVPAASRFRPELILVSAGYDAHWADRLAKMQVTTAGFARMMRTIKKLGEEFSKGRIVLSLEGGYNLRALSFSVKATLDVLLGNDDIEDPMGASSVPYDAPDIIPLIDTLKEIHNLG